MSHYASDHHTLIQRILSISSSIPLSGAYAQSQSIAFHSISLFPIAAEKVIILGSSDETPLRSLFAIILGVGVVLPPALGALLHSFDVRRQLSCLFDLGRLLY